MSRTPTGRSSLRLPPPGVSAVHPTTRRRERDGAGPAALRFLEPHALRSSARRFPTTESCRRERSTEAHRRAAISPRRSPHRAATSTGTNMRVPRKVGEQPRRFRRIERRHPASLDLGWAGRRRPRGCKFRMRQRTAAASACLRIRDAGGGRFEATARRRRPCGRT